MLNQIKVQLFEIRYLRRYYVRNVSCFSCPVRPFLSILSFPRTQSRFFWPQTKILFVGVPKILQKIIILFNQHFSINSIIILIKKTILNTYFWVRLNKVQDSLSGCKCKKVNYFSWLHSLIHVCVCVDTVKLLSPCLCVCILQILCILHLPTFTPNILPFFTHLPHLKLRDRLLDDFVCLLSQYLKLI